MVDAFLLLVNNYECLKNNLFFILTKKLMGNIIITETTGLSHDFVRQLQSNSKKTYNFSVETFYKISVALDVSMNKLIKK